MLNKSGLHVLPAQKQLVPFTAEVAAIVNAGPSVLFCLVIQCFASIPGILKPDKRLWISGKQLVDLFPTFFASSVELLDILVKGALPFGQAVRRGKHAGGLVQDLMTIDPSH